MPGDGRAPPLIMSPALVADGPRPIRIRIRIHSRWGRALYSQYANTATYTASSTDALDNRLGSMHRDDRLYA